MLKYQSDPDQAGMWMFLCIILSTVGALFVAWGIGNIFIYFNLKRMAVFIGPVGLYCLSFIILVMSSFSLIKWIAGKKALSKKVKAK